MLKGAAGWAAAKGGYYHRLMVAFLSIPATVPEHTTNSKALNDGMSWGTELEAYYIYDYAVQSTRSWAREVVGQAASLRGLCAMRTLRSLLQPLDV